MVAEDPKGPLAAESAYASALCYQNATVAAHHGRPEKATAALAPRSLTSDETAMVASFNRFLCGHKPAAGDKEDVQRTLDVEYARARTFFDAHQWPKAVLAFRAIALSTSDPEAGMAAADLYLEAANVMAKGGAPTCYDQMGDDARTLVELRCKPGSAANTDGCTRLSKIRWEVARLKLDHDVKAIGEHDADAAPRFEQAGNGYLSIWNEAGKSACEAKQPLCDRMDEVLTNAARAFSAASLLAKAIAVRQTLVDPRNNLHTTALARRAVHEIGKNYQSIAVYDEAATWYERFAREDGSAPEAAEALQDAIVLRLGLGQDELAAKGAELFQKTWGERKPALSARVVGYGSAARPRFPNSSAAIAPASTRTTAAPTCPPTATGSRIPT